MSNIYGYIRVSSRDQNLDRQVAALNECGHTITRIFSDKMSGKDFNRPSYQEMLSVLCEGDLVIIKSIDRLGRSYDDIIDQWRMITDMGVDIEVLDMPLLNTRSQVDGLTGSFISSLVLQVLSYVAQIERENIKTRQAEGIKSALEKGVKFGRRAMNMDNVNKVSEMVKSGMSVKRACYECGVGVSTYYKYRTEIN